MNHGMVHLIPRTPHNLVMLRNILTQHYYSKQAQVWAL